MCSKKLKGQSTLEYVMMIGFVVAALILIGIYVHRGMQGKLHESADQIGEQYEAGKTVSEFTTSYIQEQHESALSGGHTDTTVTINEQTKKGSENLTL